MNLVTLADENLFISIRPFRMLLQSALLLLSWERKSKCSHWMANQD